MKRIALACTALFALCAPAFAAEILIGDAKSSPESLSIAPNGDLYVGSAASPFVYKIKKGSNKAEKFIDASAMPAGTFYFGQLVEGATLWTCQLSPVAGTSNRHTALVAYDIKTAKEKLRWALPGDNNVCNDFSIGPDKALYIADTGNARIFRLAPGATSAELWLEHRNLTGIDGITFLNGSLYVNSVFFNKLWRVDIGADGKPAVGADGKPKAPVDIWVDAPMKAPDGMRAMNGKLLVAENAGGRVDSLTINGDTAHLTVLKDGLTVPTAVEPAGDTIWIANRGAGYAVSIPAPK